MSLMVKLIHLLHSSFYNFLPPINFEQSTPYFFHFVRKCAVYQLEIKSTAVDETIICWKLHPPWWKCFERDKCSIFRSKWKKYGMKRQKTASNWKNNRWWNNYTAWKGFSSSKWLIKSREKGNNGINEPFSEDRKSVV